MRVNASFCFWSPFVGQRLISSYYVQLYEYNVLYNVLYMIFTCSLVSPRCARTRTRSSGTTCGRTWWCSTSSAPSTNFGSTTAATCAPRTSTSCALSTTRVLNHKSKRIVQYLLVRRRLRLNSSALQRQIFWRRVAFCSTLILDSTRTGCRSGRVGGRLRDFVAHSVGARRPRGQLLLQVDQLVAPPIQPVRQRLPPRTSADHCIASLTEVLITRANIVVLYIPRWPILKILYSAVQYSVWWVRVRVRPLHLFYFLHMYYRRCATSCARVPAPASPLTFSASATATTTIFSCGAAGTYSTSTSDAFSATQNFSSTFGGELLGLLLH